MATNWPAKTKALILSGEVPEAHIIAMRKILSRALNHADNSWMTGTPSCNGEQAEQILELLTEARPHVTIEQARKGAAWLHNGIFTKRGEQRATDFARQFSDADMAVVRFLHKSENPRFALIGFFDSRDYGKRYCTLLPIYRAFGEGMASFDYIARAWQAGGNSFIERHA